MLIKKVMESVVGRAVWPSTFRGNFWIDVGEEEDKRVWKRESAGIFSYESFFLLIKQIFISLISNYKFKSI